MSNKLNLVGKTLPELESFVLSLNMKKFKGKQIADWIYKKNIDNINDFTNFSKIDRLPKTGL